MTVKIRPAKIQDLDELVEMQAAFETYFQKLGCDAYEVDKEARKAMLSELYFGVGEPRIRTFIAEVEGRVAGRVSFYKGFQAVVPPMFIFHLSGIYVKEEYRGLRLTQKLFDVIHQEAIKEGVGRIVWSVWGPNKPAVKAYERVGGQYYETVEDEHFLFLDVDK